MNTFVGSMSKNVLVWTFLTTNDVGNEGSDAISLQFRHLSLHYNESEQQNNVL